MNSLNELHQLLDNRSQVVGNLEQRLRGDVPIALIDAKTRAKMGNRLLSLQVNYSNLAVQVLAERLRIRDWTVDGKVSPELAQIWKRNRMASTAMQAHVLSLGTGAAYISVWSANGEPAIKVEHPSQCVAKTDPTTGEVTVAMKRWVQDGWAWCVVYEPDTIAVYRSSVKVPEGGVIPTQGYETVRVVPNPLRQVPIVPLINAQTISEPFGSSETRHIADLQDAVTKLWVDMLVTSESSAKPRRWATGVEIEVDEGGRVADPWEGSTNTAQSESPETKFGQFPAADLSGYERAASQLIRAIGALSGLPPGALGLHVDNYPSAEAQRSAESSLVARAEQRQDLFSGPWSQVAALALAVKTGQDPRKIFAEPLWADAGTSSESAAADAAVKLFSVGLLSRKAALSRLGYSDEQAQQIERDAAREAALRSIGGA